MRSPDVRDDNWPRPSRLSMRVAAEVSVWARVFDCLPLPIRMMSLALAVRVVGLVLGIPELDDLLRALDQLD
jgi:hypothetical protein